MRRITTTLSTPYDMSKGTTSVVPLKLFPIIEEASRRHILARDDIGTFGLHPRTHTSLYDYNH